SYSIPHYPSLMIAMAKPAFLAIQQTPQEKSVIVFCSSRKQCRSTAKDLLQLAHADGDDSQFLNVDIEDLRPHLERIQERPLADSLEHGIGYYHEALSKSDKRLVEHLYEAGAFKVLLASRETAWELKCKA